MQAATEIRSAVKDQHYGPHRFHSGNLALLTRSSTTTQSSGSSKLGPLGLEKPGDGKARSMAALTRGASFRRQGSSGMTWTDNWVFTDDGMFSRNVKVNDEKLAAANATRPAPEASSAAAESGFNGELQRSLSVGSGSRKQRGSHRHGFMSFKWIKKSLRKAFR